jgi:hypothetical protein
MGWAIRRHRKDKAGGLPSRGPTGAGAGALVEHRQPMSFLCLAVCKSGGLKSYKRAFITRFQFTHLLMARTLFLTGVGILRTGYLYIEASSQDSERGVHPCTSTCHAVPDPAS